MTNYYFTDKNGHKRGPLDEQKLQEFANYKLIAPDTFLKTDTGHEGYAGQIPGLVFPEPLQSTPKSTTNFFYTDSSGQRLGPYNDGQLKALAAQGFITPQTVLESDSGHRGHAGQIPGLFQQSTFQSQSISVPLSPSDNRKNTKFIAGTILCGIAGICILLTLYFQYEMLKYAKIARSLESVNMQLASSAIPSSPAYYDGMPAFYYRGEVGDAEVGRNIWELLI